MKPYLTRDDCTQICETNVNFGQQNLRGNEKAYGVKWPVIRVRKPTRIYVKIRTQ